MDKFKSLNRQNGIENRELIHLLRVGFTTKRPGRFGNYYPKKSIPESKNLKKNNGFAVRSYS